MTQTQQKEDGDRIHGVVHANIVKVVVRRASKIVNDAWVVLPPYSEKGSSSINTRDSKLDATRDS
jgi:hypothetical protein